MLARRPYPIFMSAAALYFASVGLQGVIFSALVVFELAADPIWVGTAQSALMVPSVFFVLIGGHVADLVDRRRLLIGLCVAAGILSLSLLGVVASGGLTLGVVIAYALAAGTVQAFIMPARDSMLSDMTDRDLTNAVAGLLLAQWGSQAAGALIGSSASFVGIEAVLLAHAALIFGGIPLLALLPTSRAIRHGAAEPVLKAVMGGLHEVLRTPVLRIPFLLAFSVGIFAIGPYIVVMPVLVRNYYGGGVGELGLINTAFPIGTIAGSMLVLRRGIQRKGSAQGLALSFSASCLLVIASGIPFYATLLCVVLWGTSGAIFMNAGRSIFQEKAPASHRGRVLSVYTLGFMGASGLIGAPLFGAMLDWIGIHASLAVAATGTLATVGGIFLLGGFAIVDQATAVPVPELAPEGAEDESPFMGLNQNACFVITGSLTHEGTVVYLAADGSWAAKLQQAETFADAEQADTRLDIVKAAEAVVTEPYHFKAARTADGILPLSAREELRSQGPSTRLRRPDGTGAL
jgi:MFS family permease